MRHVCYFRHILIACAIEWACCYTPISDDQVESSSSSVHDSAGICLEDETARLQVSLLQTGVEVLGVRTASESLAREAAIRKKDLDVRAAMKGVEMSQILQNLVKAEEQSTGQVHTGKALHGPRGPASALLTTSDKRVLLTTTDYATSLFVFALVATAAYFVFSSIPSDAQTTSFSPLIAEFVGTFVLVFTVCCCSVGGSSTWNATAIGSVLMAMIYATGPLSGGNLNPAVSLALGVAGKLPWSSVFQYSAVQAFAGILASFSACCLFSPMPATVGPVAPFLWWQAGMIETFYTAMLCFVVLNTAASRRNNSPEDGNQFFALAIGFVIIAGGYPSSAISGAHFNPAVSIGLEMVANDAAGWGFVWTCFQCNGSLIAVLLYKLLRPDDDEEPSEGSDSTLIACCFAETLGACVFVATVGLNVIMESPATAWSAAAALMCMIYSLGDVSGAHLNPAVTIAVCASGRGKCSCAKAGAYMCAQLLGGCIGGAICASVAKSSPSASSALPLQLGKGHTVLSAGMGELIFTALLVYVVLATATTVPPRSQKSRQNCYFALCIGACVMIGGTCMGSVSGGELNPAVSIGRYSANLFRRWEPPQGEASLLQVPGPLPNVTGWVKEQKDHMESYSERPLGLLIFFTGFEMFGGLVAALLFRGTHASDYARYDASLSTSTISLFQSCLAEFVGTFYLVFTVGCCCLSGSGTWNALAIALALMVMIYSTGAISGGHLNPAVSLCLTLCNKIDVRTLMTYWLAQTSAGILAAVSFYMFFDNGVKLEATGGFTWVHALIVEAMYTLMLCFVVTNCAVSKRNNSPEDGNQFFGLAIGFVIVAGGYAAGGISGACFNPAVSLALDFSNFLQMGALPLFNWGLAWSMAELFGSVLAATLFRLMRREDFDDEGSVAMSDKEPSVPIKCLSEFLGVFFLVTTVGLNIIMESTATALSAAAALMTLIYSLGDISGAHFNPAVTIAVVLSGRDKCSPHLGAAYVVFQLLGAMFAGHLYANFHMAGSHKAVAHPLQPGSGYTFPVAAVVEMFFTGVLAYTVLATATVRAPRSQRSQKNFFFGLAIASCVIAGGLSGGSISGGELNPAVSLGITFANLAHKGHGQMLQPGSFIPFSLWQLSGGIIAALVFRFTNANEFVKTGGVQDAMSNVPPAHTSPTQQKVVVVGPARSLNNSKLLFSR